MRGSLNTRRVAMLAVAVAGMPHAALAQTTPAASGVEDPQVDRTPTASGDIIVTARKRGERLINVPASITAETGADLQRRGATQLEDIIRNTPGINNSGDGQGNRTSITIRGVSTGTSNILKQSTVALLLDDIPVDPQTASQLSTNLRTVDIERVEVLRGPQGTLFGSGSLSGAVRFITNKPSFAGIGGGGEVSVATTWRGEPSYSGNIVLNAPLVDQKLAIRAIGYGFRDGGWVDNVVTGEKDVNRTDTYGGRLALVFKPTDRLTINVTGIYQDSRDLGFGESLYSPTPGIRDYRNATTLAAQSSNKLRNTLVNLAIQYELAGVTLFSSSTYQRRQTNAYQDVGFFNDYLGGLFGIPGLAGLAPNNIDTDSDIYTQELRVSSSGSGPLRWTLGGFYLDASRNGTQLITSAAIVPILGTNLLASLLSTGSQRELSGFGEVTYTVADRLDITGGARISRTTVDFDTASAGLLLTQNPDPTAIVRNKNLLKETNVNPRFSIAYRPNADATLYVQAARGYRVGGPNLSGRLAGGGVPLTYGSDSLWNYEAGVKARLADGRVRLSGAAFYIDWTNIQTSLSLNSVAYTGNAGSGRVIGVELEAAVNLTSNVQFGGSFTASNSKLTSSTPNLTRVTGAIGVFSGERLPASPERQATGYAEFRQIVGGRQAYLRATAQYIGPEFTDFGAKGTRFGDFATLDVRAGVELGPVEAVAFVNNLFNSQGARSAADPLTLGPTFVAVPQLAYRTRPRTVGLTLRARFGSESR